MVFSPVGNIARSMLEKSNRAHLLLPPFRFTEVNFRDNFHYFRHLGYQNIELESIKARKF